MGTTGTITGVSRFLKEQNPGVRIIGAQPAEGSRIPGIRKWPEAYLPKIYDPTGVDELVLVRARATPRTVARRMAAEEGLFAGISAAGACWVALQIARQVENATIAFIVCDRGDRYLSTACLSRMSAAPGRPKQARSPLGGQREARRGASMKPYRFCPDCASELALITQAEDGGDKERLRCAGLRLHALEQPDAGSGRRHRVHGPSGSGVAGAQCGLCRESFFGLITGFLEAGESPEEGIRREIAEETSLEVDSLEPAGRLGLPTHEPDHHCLSRGRAGRDHAVAGTGPSTS